MWELTHVLFVRRKESTLTNTHRSQNVWHIHLEKCKKKSFNFHSDVRPKYPTKTKMSDQIVGLRECWLWNLSDILGGICRTWENDRWYTWTVLCLPHKEPLTCDLRYYLPHKEALTCDVIYSLPTKFKKENKTCHTVNTATKFNRKTKHTMLRFSSHFFLFSSCF